MAWTDTFGDELESMIDAVTSGKDVVSMDEAQRREVIYGEWFENMAFVWRALERNRKIILAPGYADTNEAALKKEPIVALLRQHKSRSPDRMIFSPAFDHKGKPEDIARMVSVSYWPDYFPEGEYDEGEDELDFTGNMNYKIDDLEFKKQIAMFIAGKLQV